MNGPACSLSRWLVLALLLFGTRPAAWAAAELVSVSTGHEQTNFGQNSHGRADATGRFVVFESSSAELVSNDDNNATDIFLRDRATGETTRVSFDLEGKDPDGESFAASISADGGVIVFTSSASNLVANDTNGLDDVFVYDRSTKKITRASVATNGAQAEGGGSIFATISGNGRFVAFVSTATNLVSNDSNGIADVFVRDLQSRVTTRVSVRPDGSQTNAQQNLSTPPSLSHDGRWVAFQSSAPDLVENDANGFADIFVHDRQANSTTIASRTTAGEPANGNSARPVLSADGAVVAFGSAAQNLVGAGINFHVVVKDLRSGVAARPRPTSNFSHSASLSADGSRVALVTQVGSADEQVEVVDRATGKIFAPARFPNGASAGTSDNPHLSADGQVVIFQASANGIVPSDENSAQDVFARPLRDTISFASTVFRANENAGSVNVTIQREGVLNGAISARYAISAAGDTAIADRDYTAAARTGTLNWPAGDLTARTLNIPLIDTPTADGYRLITVTLTSPTGGAGLGIKTAHVIIADTESDPVENRVGHGLKIVSIVQRGTNWDTGTFRALFTIRNPAPQPSFPGFIELEFKGNVLENVLFDAVPAGGDLVVDAIANVGNFPSGDVYARLFESTPGSGPVPQDSAFAAGFKSNNTAPPSGGTTMPNIGLKAENFNTVTVRSVTIEGDATVNEGTSKTYTAKVTLSDGTTQANVTPAWKTSAFTISGGGVFSAGDVSTDKVVTLTAAVTRNGTTTTGTRKITVKSVPATPIITSPLTAFATKGKAFVYKIVARHEPASFDATGLPAGLVVNKSTGVISGTATETGPFAVQISATNGQGTDTDTLNLTVSEPSPLTLNIVGNGTVTPNLNGVELDVGRKYKLVAKPAAGHLFAGWSNGAGSKAPVLTFLMVPNLVLTATFVPNPFLTRSGSYAGLIQSDPPTHAASGFILATIAKTGLCTGKIVLGGKRFSFRAPLFADGTSALITLRRSGTPPVTFTLSLDVATQNGALTGTLTSGAIEAAITANRALLETASLAGNYTVVLPAPDTLDATGETPDGSGFATVKVTGKGKVKLTGVLGDGTKMAQSTILTTGAKWPFFVPLYKAGGSVLGSITFEDLAQSHFSSQVVWFKPVRLKDPLYPGGWIAGINRDLLGARYINPPPLADLSAADADGNASIEFAAGGLSGVLSQRITILPTGVATAVAPALPKFAIKIAASTGLFSGAFADPTTGQTRRFSGAIQQKLNLGLGLFPGGLQRAGNAVLQGDAP